MDDNKKKELYSIACVNSLAAVCGHSTSLCNTDLESIDMQFVGHGFSANSIYISPEIKVQLKCTSKFKITDNHVVWNDLKIKNYNDLRRPSQLPSYLFLILVPNNNMLWITKSYPCRGLSANFAGFWYSLEGKPEISNSTKVTVKIPLEQQLDYDGFTYLMSEASQGRVAK